jgi:hypothetical protein
MLENNWINGIIILIIPVFPEFDEPYSIVWFNNSISIYIVPKNIINKNTY